MPSFVNKSFPVHFWSNLHSLSLSPILRLNSLLLNPPQTQALSPFSLLLKKADEIARNRMTSGLRNSLSLTNNRNRSERPNCSDKSEKRSNCSTKIAFVRYSKRKLTPQQSGRQGNRAKQPVGNRKCPKRIWTKISGSLQTSLVRLLASSCVRMRSPSCVRSLPPTATKEAPKLSVEIFLCHYTDSQRLCSTTD
jgi:hypothetical protein